jgi:nicotinate-nucleotide adenylyltransferase
MRRIAFFGGSFDPPHRGHLAIATAAADCFVLDQVMFAPVGHQPLKTSYPSTSFVHRYAMTVLATQADPRFLPSLLDTPSDIGDDARPNYTVETLTRLRASLLAAPEPTALFTLLGADSWLDIARWFQAPRLLALCDWIVAARPGFSLRHAEAALPPEIRAKRIGRSIDDAGEHPLPDSPDCGLLLHHADAPPTRVWFLPHLKEDISATEVRAALDEGRLDAAFLPPQVRTYIAKTGIYFSAAAARPLP